MTQKKVAVGCTALGLAFVVLVSACSSSGGSSTTASADGGTKTLTLTSVNELTGDSQGPGQAVKKGTELGVEQINAQHFLGTTSLQINFLDTTNSAQTAVSNVSSAIAKGATVILGPQTSNYCNAITPVAQSAKVPVIFTACSASKVPAGGYAWRAEPAWSTYYSVMGKYFQGKNVKRLSEIYTSDNPTETEAGTVTVPATAKTYGFEVVASASTQATTVDFASIVQRALAANPDVVDLQVLPKQAAPLSIAIRRAGFKGIISSNQGVSTSLAPGGDATVGLVLATDFVAAGQHGAAAQSFIDAFKAKFGTDPDNAAAVGYDRIWTLAKAIKAGGGSSREQIQNGMETVTKAGFEGALGQTTYVGNDAHTEGSVVVKWDGTKFVPATD